MTNMLQSNSDIDAARGEDLEDDVRIPVEVVTEDNVDEFS